MREDALLTGTLEPTNEPYAIAKIAGIKLCESYNRHLLSSCRSRYLAGGSEQSKKQAGLDTAYIVQSIGI